MHQLRLYLHYHITKFHVSIVIPETVFDMMLLAKSRCTNDCSHLDAHGSSQGNYSPLSPGATLNIILISVGNGIVLETIVNDMEKISTALSNSYPRIPLIFTSPKSS